ncbi:MAG: LacI family DNA-binding transcriptional regulator [Vibrio sp.]
MSKKITMADISKQLGISKMTVSRYFNGGYVSEENRLKIDEVVKEHHYVPNKFARSIRSQSNIIGFVAPRIDSYTTSLVIKGALAAANQHQIRMLFHATGFSHASECEAVREFHGLNSLGTILIPSKHSPKESFYKTLDNLVFIGKDLPNQCSLVYPEQDAIQALVDNVLTSTLATPEQLKAICYIYDERMLSSRTQLFSDLITQNYPQFAFSTFALSNSEEKDAYRELELKAGHFYFCATDNIAIRLYRCAKRQNLKIGQDIWVSGVGDYEYSDLLVPSLTSIAFNYYQMGYQAVEKIAKKDFSSAHGDFELKIRESSHFI